MQNLFNPFYELEKIRIAKKSHNFPSKIDRFAIEVLRLRTEGATLSELQLYLRRQRVDASLAALSRWLKKRAVAEATTNAPL